jgi:hypothetical protein
MTRVKVRNTGITTSVKLQTNGKRGDNGSWKRRSKKTKYHRMTTGVGTRDAKKAKTNREVGVLVSHFKRNGKWIKRIKWTVVPKGWQDIGRCGHRTTIKVCL